MALATMPLGAFEAFTAQLIANAERDPQVLGLVALGSMADTSRVDPWSDHDFFWVVASGTQEGYRQDLSWLPNTDQIVLHFRETAHGLKVMYGDGHLIEFAVFDLDELGFARGNDAAVLVDKADVGERIAAMVALTSQEIQHQTPNPHKDLLHCLSLLQVGTGRYARGEALSGHQFVKAHALGHLLRFLLALRIDSPQIHRLDNLDPYRRFERVYPAWGVKLNAAMLLNPLDCASALLDFLEVDIAPLYPAFPVVVASTLRQHFAVIQRANATAHPLTVSHNSPHNDQPC